LIIHGNDDLCIQITTMSRSLTNLFLFLPVLSLAQKKKSYTLNQYFEVTDKKKYVYLRKIKKKDNVIAYTNYTKKREINKQGCFKDETFTIPEGHYVFNWNGSKLFEGNYSDGVRQGTWYFYNNSELSDSLYYSKNTDAYIKKMSSPALQKNIRTDSNANEKTFVKVEVESEFPGGVKAWQKYLNKTLTFPDPVLETMRPFTKTCTVQFVVCTDGSVCNVETIESIHPLIDLVAVNAIRKGPSWKPAEQNSRKVKSYKKQPVIFSFSD